MKKINVFNYITVDGYFAGPKGEVDWFKLVEKDDEFNKQTQKEASSEGTLVFGRTTYEMMKSYWPTEQAIASDPLMANAVNNSQKIVFSKSLQAIEEGQNWKNIKLLNEINRDEVLKLKAEDGKDITIIGSGSIVQQFANLDLIDTYQLVVVPVILGEGKLLFKDVKKTNLKLIESKSFKNGLILNKYEVKK